MGRFIGPICGVILFLTLVILDQVFKPDRETFMIIYTFVGLDCDSKLVPAHLVGKRDGVTAHAFIGDLASRLNNRVQLSSDALRA